MGDQDKRTWFRELFEAQNAAFTPYDAGQSSIGWYFWAWKLEYDIDAWSYRRGLSDGYIPSNISDPSTYEYPIKKNGCIDSDHEYEAKAQVTFTTYSPRRLRRRRLRRPTRILPLRPQAVPRRPWRGSPSSPFPD